MCLYLLSRIHLINPVSLYINDSAIFKFANFNSNTNLFLLLAKNNISYLNIYETSFILRYLIYYILNLFIENKITYLPLIPTGNNIFINNKG